MEDLKSELLFEIHFELDAWQVVGTTPHGTRQIIYVMGGSFAGSKLNRETRSVPMTSVLTETLQAIRINADQQAPVFLNSKGNPYRDISTALQTAV